MADHAPHRSRAEQETLFRWDEEERVLWASTTCPRVAHRWSSLQLKPRVIGRYRDGSDATWELKLPWTGHKRPWLAVISAAISGWNPATAAQTAVDKRNILP